jgi:hypothetical protein
MWVWCSDHVIGCGYWSFANGVLADHVSDDASDRLVNAAVARLAGGSELDLASLFCEVDDPNVPAHVIVERGVHVQGPRVVAAAESEHLSLIV